MQCSDFWSQVTNTKWCCRGLKAKLYDQTLNKSMISKKIFEINDASNNTEFQHRRSTCDLYWFFEIRLW